MHNKSADDLHFNLTAIQPQPPTCIIDDISQPQINSFMNTKDNTSYCNIYNLLRFINRESFNFCVTIKINDNRCEYNSFINNTIDLKYDDFKEFSLMCDSQYFFI